MLALRIAIRYLFSRKSHHAVNVISAISVAAVAVATTAIVIVLSVFNGFVDLAASQYSRIDPPLLITPTKGKVMTNATSLAQKVALIDGVNIVLPTITETGLLACVGTDSPSEIAITFKGVTDQHLQAFYADLTIHSVETATLWGSPTDFDLYTYGACLPSPGIASVLHLYQGASVEVYVPKRVGRINPANPAGAFRSAPLLVSGVISSGEAEFDSQYVIIPLQTARDLLDYFQDEASALEVSVTKGADIEKVKKAISTALGDRFIVQNRDEQQSDNFKMISIEKWVSFFLLISILLIATFNIISTISLLVIEKRDNMATLRFLGASDKMVKRIFMAQSSLITLFGGILGIILGVALALAQQYGEFIKLSGDTTQLSVSAYPIHVVWDDIIAVAAALLIIAFATAFISLAFSRKHLTDPLCKQ